jgi:hypothetical protein
LTASTDSPIWVIYPIMLWQGDKRIDQHHKMSSSSNKETIHLFTCEMDICDYCCDLRLKTITKLKTHSNDGNHFIVNSKYFKITHAKQGKTSESEIKYTTYYKGDFISKKKR